MVWKKGEWGFKGHTFSKATREKFRQNALKNKPSGSPEARAKISRYMKLHNPLAGKFAEKHPNWKGGRKKSVSGYIWLYKPNHPLAMSNGKRRIYIKEHRYIMEQFILKKFPNHPSLIIIKGAYYLSPKWVVHHKNGVKDDNRLSNLLLLPSSEHKSLESHKSEYWKYQPEQKKLGKIVACNICGKKFYRQLCRLKASKNCFCGFSCYGKWRSKSHHM